MDEQKNRVDAIIEAAEEHIPETDGDEDNLIRLSTGVILQAEQVSPMLINDVVSLFPIPDPPTVYIEDKGVSEPNPNNPEYISQVGSVEMQRSKAMFDAIVLMGTTLVERPESVLGPDDKKWQRKMAVLGYQFRHEYDAYLTWVKLVAAPEPGDIAAIMRAVGGKVGVSEEDVAETMQRLKS
jgi:hypothetical protein